MRVLSILIFRFYYFGCKSQNRLFLEKLDNKMLDCINSSNRDDKEKKRYINNEIKYIFYCRKKIFSKFKLNKKNQMCLIEIWNPEMVSDIYSAFLKVGSNVYVLSQGEADYSRSFEIKYEDFRNKYRMEACLFEELERDSDKLYDGSIGSSFHFTVFVTKINNEDILTSELRDICILND